MDTPNQDRSLRLKNLAEMGQQSLFGPSAEDEYFGGSTLSLRAARAADEDAEEQLTVQRAANSPLAIRANAENVPSIMDEGFKSQHHTRSSNGTYDPEYRAQWEQNAFGERFGGEHPIYGFMDDPDWQSDEGTNSYGDVKFHLNRNQFADRSTMTIGDSLGSKAKPMKVTDQVTDDKIAGAKSYDSVDVNRVGYFEAQVHPEVGAAGIPFSAVESARIDISKNDGIYEQEQKLKAGRSLSAAGVPVSHVTRERYYQQNFDAVDPGGGWKAARGRDFTPGEYGSQMRHMGAEEVSRMTRDVSTNIREDNERLTQSKMKREAGAEWWGKKVDW